MALEHRFQVRWHGRSRYMVPCYRGLSTCSIVFGTGITHRLLYYGSLGFLSPVRQMFAELGRLLHRQNSSRTVAEKCFCEV